jgi:hypothetical protein
VLPRKDRDAAYRKAEGLTVRRGAEHSLNGTMFRHGHRISRWATPSGARGKEKKTTSRAILRNTPIEQERRDSGQIWNVHHDCINSGSGAQLVGKLDTYRFPRLILDY